MERKTSLGKVKSYSFLSKSNHEKQRDQKILSWLKPLLQTDGRITIRESFRTAWEEFCKNQESVSVEIIFAPDEDLEASVFWFDIVAHDVVHDKKSDYPEFWFHFLYGDKVIVGFHFINDDSFDFIPEFYAKKMEVSFEERDRNAIRLKNQVSWNEAHALVSKLLKFRTEIIPAF
ncbi:MAG TPA: hypothetical protein PLQ20_01485 [Candidatus Paceibacterota bacterium]|nr:hypothetical protein [Candidatus Paceibacterota bacterium]